MVSFSCLRPALAGCCRLQIYTNVGRNSALSTLKEGSQLQLIRGMAGAAKVPLKPSAFQYDRFKDTLHFYIFLGFVPLSLIVVGAHVFIGPSKLVDTPEGYEPKHWEYQSHPIKRFFAKYVYEDPVHQYETHLQTLHVQTQNVLDKLFRKKIKAAMAERQDYRGYYFYTYDKEQVDKAKEHYEVHRGITGKDD